ncbi:hypothetical protein KEM52_005581, partial [Ascosphaera acerosa]
RQALLERYESLAATADQDRAAMLLRISQLEAEKLSIQRDNGTMIDENQRLLNQLAALNQVLADSDAEIQGMAATLQTARSDMQVLEGSAARVALLEETVARLEGETREMSELLDAARGDEAAAVARCRQAEGRLQLVQEELARLEQEMSDERERHAQVVERMQRRRKVEKELDAAAARLKMKGCAATAEPVVPPPPRKGHKRAATMTVTTAATTLRDGLPGVPSSSDAPDAPDVVTSFVRDILTDNATLQSGIVELRAMLHNSNDEVQLLREQLLLMEQFTAQSASAAPAHHHLPQQLNEDGAHPAPLSDELQASLGLAPGHDCNTDTMPSPAMHVHHHHYHTPIANTANIYLSPHQRRGRRRRTLAPSTVPSPQDTARASAAKHRAQQSRSSIATIISQTAATVPTPDDYLQQPLQATDTPAAGKARHRRRCASQSTIASMTGTRAHLGFTDYPCYTNPSLASSPQSRGDASIFSTMDARGFESSWPTSPESSAVLSPPLPPGRFSLSASQHHRRCHSDAPTLDTRPLNEEAVCDLASPIDLRRLSLGGENTDAVDGRGMTHDGTGGGRPSVQHSDGQTKVTRAPVSTARGSGCNRAESRRPSVMTADSATLPRSRTSVWELAAEPSMDPTAIPAHDGSPAPNSGAPKHPLAQSHNSDQPYSSRHALRRTPTRVISATTPTTHPPSPVLTDTNIIANAATLAVTADGHQTPHDILHQIAAALERSPADADRGAVCARVQATETTVTSPIDQGRSRADCDSHARPQPQSPTALASDRAATSSARSSHFSIGGWVLGKWGVMPTRTKREGTADSNGALSAPSGTAADDRRPSSSPTASPARGDSPRMATVTGALADPLLAMLGRPTGVNQRGPVPGLAPPPEAPTSLEPEVDRALLAETLQE